MAEGQHLKPPRHGAGAPRNSQRVRTALLPILSVHRAALVVTSVAVVCGLGMWITTNTLAQERGTNVRRHPAQAGSLEDSAQMEQELKKVLATQQQILDRFDELMKELQIVKARATRRRAPNQ